ncbi:MAG: acyl transferase, partial [Bacteroidota bacterium]
MNTKGYNFVNILSSVDFEREALQLFRKQASENKIYQAYMAHLAINPASVTQLSQIPFLPIEFFKTQKVFCDNQCPE